MYKECSRAASMATSPSVVNPHTHLCDADSGRRVTLPESAVPHNLVASHDTRKPLRSSCREYSLNTVQGIDTRTTLSHEETVLVRYGPPHCGPRFPSLHCICLNHDHIDIMTVHLPLPLANLPTVRCLAPSGHNRLAPTPPCRDDTPSP